MSDMYPVQFNERGDLSPPSYGTSPSGDPLYFQFNDRGDITVPNFGFTGQGDMIAFPTTAHGDIAPYHSLGQTEAERRLAGIQQHLAATASAAIQESVIANSPSGNEVRRIDVIRMTMNLASQKDPEVDRILADPNRFAKLRHEWNIGFGLAKMVRRGYLLPDRSRRSLDDVPGREYAGERIAAAQRTLTLTDKELRQEGYGEIQGDGTRRSEAVASLGRIMSSNTTKLTLFEMWFSKQLYDLGKVA